MDFAYSPHREGGTMHLASPTHPHYRMEGFSSIEQLRQSLSRSPSRPSRFRLRNTDSPGSPISPLALARAFSPKALKHNTNNHNNNTASPFAESPLAAQSPAATTTVKKRFTLRRSAPFRSSPRNRTTSKSPRRALADSADHGNTTPFTTRAAVGEENAMPRRSSAEILEQAATEQKAAMRFEMNDQPIDFKLARSRHDTNAPGANCLLPPKSSPLKRSDGVMNLDAASTNSPVPKRRSLHGASAFGNTDFDIFDPSTTPRTSLDEPNRSLDNEPSNSFSFSSPIGKTSSPLRKTASLRKSTLSQRHGAGAARPKPAYDGEFMLPGPAASKTRQRMSLDSSIGSNFSAGAQTPFRRSVNLESSRPMPHQPFSRSLSGQPHPLSNALTPSSSNSDMSSPARGFAPVPPPAPRHHAFSRSLPIGATRPHLPEGPHGETFETPMAYKMARPDPSAFMSTGLLSKKNRNVEELEGSVLGGYVMPDTPSKRNSFPPVTASPTVDRIDRTRAINFGKSTQHRPEFGTPSTPFGFHVPQTSTESFGKGVGIFGSFGSNHQRRSSFASIDGDDVNNSPSANRMADSQSSADDMPPTPTKGHDGSGRRSKESSLRRKTFRQRTSIGTDTFLAPETETSTPVIDIPGAFESLNGSRKGAISPHTPNETSFMPPDPSKLSISGNRRGSLPFNASTNSNLSFPPATPTTPRDHTNYFANGQPNVAPMVGLTQNDVDQSLAERFQSITLCGSGEFSKVYRVEKPVGRGLSLLSPPTSRVWAVKKSKKPYTGNLDREKKMREVHILRALSGHDHILSLSDSWEFQNHLYIQTEFCENGNLKDFLASAGYKSRLDDFRIWKILLELSLGVNYIHSNGYIHLDLKPANVFIDFHGSLKIGDFGLASTWPAARHIDGEGDRHYLAPEALQGRYDKPGDVYALGTIMCEIAANIVLPENGSSWMRLRSGDFSELPSLVWSSESSLNRDENGEPIDAENALGSSDLACVSTPDENSLQFITGPSAGLDKAPAFMIEPGHPDSLDRIAQAMMDPEPDRRPTMEDVYRCFGCQWVEQRTRAGATIYEGNWGPSDDVLHHDLADAMDTS
ncbi:kinase-like protein [Aaosphaeria arxii CBS 175.79]|uniref:Kinase-like protein n=1 Tax=Aaosphaeria arxii CBS 175.79 TaxID=1450172 RepID=A0A6A5XHZ1_9PLEO|nr:kinase-like protein [Aaosphaeria arxii CBS 175.79]KAF2011934.1 kinase-like protein [Aaosphaeria arxii CBS 175.79]